MAVTELQFAKSRPHSGNGNGNTQLRTSVVLPENLARIMQTLCGILGMGQSEYIVYAVTKDLRRRKLDLNRAPREQDWASEEVCRL